MSCNFENWAWSIANRKFKIESPIDLFFPCLFESRMNECNERNIYITFYDICNLIFNYSANINKPNSSKYSYLKQNNIKQTKGITIQ